uniref:Retrotransposon gag domain-containing protein n=1 Tax=Cannabis sativa TaxID=3483 RepID=A0A803Q744_CANSA
MRTNRSATPLTPLNREIERTLKQLKAKKNLDFTTTANNNNGPNSNQPAAAAADAQPQFGGLATKDPNIHLTIFLEVCATVKMNGVTNDVIRLRLFSFSLRDKARSWLQSLKLCSITTWDEMARKFMVKFFPPPKSAQLRSEIGQFRQFDPEQLYEAWEIFKDLLRPCTQHGYESWIQVSIFNNGLNGQPRSIIDVAAGGALLSKPATEAINLLEEMATNSYNRPNEINTPRKKNTSTVENVATTSTSQVPEMSIEQAQCMANRLYNNNYRGNPMTNYYHLGLRNHEILFMVEVGQLANVVSALQKNCSFPSNTVVNLKEQCNAISVRSGKVLDGGVEDKSIGLEVEDIVEAKQETHEEKPTDKSMKKEDLPMYKPPIPYPQRFMKKKLDEDFAEFLEIFKKINNNIPFIDELEQMPNYVKFMKEKLPQKLKDLSSFSIPHEIGALRFENSLCDLGASINLIPLSVFKKLGNSEVKRTTISLQLEDHSFTYPRGIIEDVLIKVDDRRGHLTLSANDEEIKFNIYNSYYQANTENTCNMVEYCNSNKVNRETYHKEKTKKPPDKKKPKEELLIGQEVLVIHSKFKSLTSNVILRWKNPFEAKELLPGGLVILKNDKGGILKVHKRKLKGCTDDSGVLTEHLLSEET